VTWRYIARRAVSGEILDWDLPIVREELSWALSGAGFLRGTIAPDAGRHHAADGKPLLDEWGTLLYAEHSGQLRWAGILTRSGFTGPAWQIEAAGLSTYLHGMPYLGSYSQIKVDPLTVVRHLWSHVQGYPDGGLGVQVDATTSPVRLGIPGIAAYDEVQLDGKWVRKSSVASSLIDPSAAAKLKTAIDNNDTALTLAAPDKFGQADLPFTVSIGNEKIQVRARSGTRLSSLVRGFSGTTATGHNAGTKVTYTGTPTRTIPAVPAEPYLLSWWEAPDCGTELDQLAAETPFDYAEHTAWTSSGGIEHRIRLGYPRLGRRRNDLAFVQGDNVTSVVTATRDGDGYANEIVAIGAGDGSATLQRRLPGRDGRLRRPQVWTN
jgi:hypothetical protein